MKIFQPARRKADIHIFFGFSLVAPLLSLAVVPFLFSILSGLLWFQPAMAAEPRTSGGIFTLYWENDALVNTDRDYTNGLKLTWSTDLLPHHRTPNPVQRWGNALMDRLPFINDLDAHRGLSISLGHSIYTPFDINSPELIPGDRPYAACLSAALALSATIGHRLTVWEIDLGVVGPLAQGEIVQNIAHEITGSARARGWEHQLDNEPALGVICETKWRLWDRQAWLGTGVGLITHLGGRLGNLATYANAGAELRFGWRLKDDFGSCPIRPGCDFSSIADLNPAATLARHPLSVFFFIAGDGRLVLHDIFLDGNTSGHSHSVDREPLVADIMAGMVVYYKRFRASYAHVLRTRQYEGQAQEQLFGAFTVSLVY